MAYEGWIADLLGIKTVRHNGGPEYPQRSSLDFQGDVSITDDVVNDKLIISIALQNTNDTFQNYKTPARVATTANITLSGLLTIDGVTLNSNDRVLVKNQSVGADNGVYVAAATAWSRATDFDASAEVNAGLLIVVTEGTANADSVWQLATNNPITLGVSALVFAQVGSSSATALRGVNLDPTTISAPATSDVVSFDGVKYVAGKITNAMVAAGAALAVSKLAAGSNGQFLRTTAGVPVWAAVSSSDLAENVITPAALASQADNYSPSGFADATVVRVSSTGNVDLTGLDATATLKRKTVVNVGSNRITLRHNFASAASNRFSTPSGLDWPLAPGESAVVLYDSSTAMWRVLGMWGLSSEHTWTAIHYFNAGLGANGDIYTLAGNISTGSGTISGTTLSATGKVYGGTGLEATMGDIEAVAGNVIADLAVTAGTNVQAAQNVIAANGYVQARGGPSGALSEFVHVNGAGTQIAKSRTIELDLNSGRYETGWSYTPISDDVRDYAYTQTNDCRVLFPVKLPADSVITSVTAKYRLHEPSGGGGNFTVGPNVVLRRVKKNNAQATTVATRDSGPGAITPVYSGAGPGYSVAEYTGDANGNYLTVSVTGITGDATVDNGAVSPSTRTFQVLFSSGTMASPNTVELYGVTVTIDEYGPRGYGQ